MSKLLISNQNLNLDALILLIIHSSNISLIIFEKMRTGKVPLIIFPFVL